LAACNGSMWSVGEQTVLGWRWAHRAGSGHGVVSNSKAPMDPTATLVNNR
jgi:hypothetical protein